MSEQKKQAQVTISKESAEQFRKFLEENKKYLSTSAGVFHTDNHGNW